MKETKVLSVFKRGEITYKNRHVMEAGLPIPPRHEFCKELMRIATPHIG